MYDWGFCGEVNIYVAKQQERKPHAKSQRAKTQRWAWVDWGWGGDKEAKPDWA